MKMLHAGLATSALALTTIAGAPVMAQSAPIERAQASASSEESDLAGTSTGLIIAAIAAAAVIAGIIIIASDDDDEPSSP